MFDITRYVIVIEGITSGNVQGEKDSRTVAL